MSKIKLTLPQARTLAEKIKAALEPGCERVEIAGSIRRMQSLIGDIEIVAIPKYAPSLLPDITGESLLDIMLSNLVEDERLIPGDKNGPKFKQFGIPAIEGLTLDLFITDKDCWPVIFAIRTGSARFSQLLVTRRDKGGLLPSHFNVTDGRVWENGQAVKLDSERDFLELCGGWVEPMERS